MNRFFILISVFVAAGLMAASPLCGQMITAGEYFDPINWTDGFVPQGPGAVADLYASGTITVTNTPAPGLTIGSINFYGDGTGINLTGDEITLDNVSSNVNLMGTFGACSVANNLVLNSDVTTYVLADVSLTLGGAISQGSTPHGISTTGGGTLKFITPGVTTSTIGHLFADMGTVTFDGVAAVDGAGTMYNAVDNAGIPLHGWGSSCYLGSDGSTTALNINNVKFHTAGDVYMGYAGGTANINLTGTGAFVQDSGWAQLGYSGSINLTMSNTSTLNLANSNFGHNGNGTLKMYNSANFTTVGENRFGNGPDAIADVELHDDAKIVGGAVRMSDTPWGDGAGKQLTLKMFGNSQIESKDWLVIGNGQTSTEVTMGDPATPDTEDHPVISNTAWMNMGVSYGATNAACVLKMYAHSEMMLGWEADFGYNLGGNIDMSLNNHAHIGSTGNLQIGHVGGQAVIVMTGDSSMTAASSAKLGCGATGDSAKRSLDLTMSGTANINGGGIEIGNLDGSNVLVHMTGNSKLSAAVYLVLGNNLGTAADITIGTKGSVTDACEVSASDWLNIGCYGATSTVRLNGGSSLSTGIAYVGHTNGAVADVSVNDKANFAVVGTLFIGAAGGSGALHVGSDSASDAELSAKVISLGSESSATALIDLNAGGTIKTERIYTENTPNTSTINFNGGTLKATAGDVAATETTPAIAFINNDGAAADYRLNVLAGGAIIDTQGFDDTIVPVLGNHAGGDMGGLTKLGAGSLTLAASPAYNGDTIVNEGALYVPNLHTPSAEVSVATGATLTASSIEADTLTIGVPVLEAGGAIAVPEPSTIALLVLAGLTLTGAYVRRK